MIVDSFEVVPGEETRLAEAIALARDLGDGLVILRLPGGARETFSSRRACPECGFSIEELTPRMFSFNNPFGACPECLGIGATLHADPDRIVPDKEKPLAKAIAVWGLTPDARGLADFAAMFDYRPNRPVRELSEKGWKAMMYGSDKSLGWSVRGPGHWWGTGWLREGLVAAVERRWKSTKSESAKEYYLGFLSFKPCLRCGGKRLKPASLAVTVEGKSIADVAAMTVLDAAELFRALTLMERDEQIVGQVVKEIRSRLRFLENVGLTYLTLDRGSGTLSGGEAERIALATQIGSGLVGVLYILDEPSIGLHPRDHARLLSTLKTLRDLGNTLLVVEHRRDDDARVRLVGRPRARRGRPRRRDPLLGSAGGDRRHPALGDRAVPLGPTVDRGPGTAGHRWVSGSSRSMDRGNTT